MPGLDALHENLSGAATRHLCERAWLVYGDARYECLSAISVAHLYNLRHATLYRQARGHWEPTRPSRAVSIAIRKAPEPEGRAGFIRIDSEYINARVTHLLDKLNAEFTKSRPRCSKDNALVEAKNGVVIRRTFGYAHIPQRHAARINVFCREYLVPYLNLHRPCLFPEQAIDLKGKIRTTYPPQLVRTPLEKLQSLPARARSLKPGITLQDLLWQARSMSDNEAAERMQKARSALFTTINRRTAAQAA